MRETDLWPRLCAGGLISALTASLATTDLGLAQDQTTPLPEKKGVRITFLPPPLEGTLSLGVYTLEGKLVRVLASEATHEKFAIGLNGLIIDWDGKDDAGNVLPAGKYFLRGYAVGDLGIEGVAFHGNDWMLDDESPHLRDILEMSVAEDELLIAGTGTDGGILLVHFDRTTGRHTFERVARENPVPSSPAAATLAEKARRGIDALGAAEENPSGPWVIETTGEGAAARRSVVQRAGNEIVRALEIAPGEPQPVRVAAAPGDKEIYLIERHPAQVRLRGLRLKETLVAEGGKNVSHWEVFLNKSIWKSNTFDEFRPQLRREPPFAPEPHVHVRLVSNPLVQVEMVSLRLGAAIERAGSFLRSIDGLPLLQLTTTPNLKWVMLGRALGNQALPILQSDGAVVEEFRINTPGKIMAFDAGEYEWAGAGR